MGTENDYVAYRVGKKMMDRKARDKKRDEAQTAIATILEDVNKLRKVVVSSGWDPALLHMVHEVEQQTFTMGAQLDGYLEHQEEMFMEWARKQLAERSIEVPEICALCHTPMRQAPGIGTYCPNKKCDNLDGPGISPQPVSTPNISPPVSYLEKKRKRRRHPA